MKTLTNVGLFYTPKSTEELEEWIERLSGAERALAYTVMGMTWNLCGHLINEEDCNEDT